MKYRRQLVKGAFQVLCTFCLCRELDASKASDLVDNIPGSQHAPTGLHEA